MSDPNKGTFINPQRMAVLGLHSLANEGQGQPQSNYQQNNYQQSYQQSSHHQSHSGQGSGGNRMHGQINRRSDNRGDERRTRRSAVPASTFRGFSYDENFRPRPKKTTTKWGVKPTVEQLRRQAAIKLGVSADDSYESLKGLGLQESTLHDPAALLDIVANTTTPIGSGAPGSANRSLHAQLVQAHTQAVGVDTESTRRPAPDRMSSYRVYCGGIPPNCSDQEIGDLFNHVIISVPERSAPPSEVPVRSITNKTNFAFIEFGNKEDMEIALSMDGIDLHGHGLRIKLPRDAVLAGQEPSRRYKIPGLIPTQVENGPCKVFLGNIPPTLDERVLKTILSEFGELAAFNLVRDSVTNASKRYAFFLLEDVTRTIPTVNALNGFKIGEYVLTCSLALPSRRESTDTNAQMDPSQMNQAFNAAAGGYAPPLPGSQPQQMMMHAEHPGANYFTGGAPQFAPQAPMQAPVQDQAQAQTQAYTTQVAPPTVSGTSQGVSTNPIGEPSSVLALHNMATEQMLKEEYDDILLDTRDELSKFGSVLSVCGMRSVIYVVFADVESARAAALETHGRGFGDQTVSVEYLPLSRWETLRLDPLMGPSK